MGENWGDKGGSTTKLVAQVCNLTNPNTATTTEILAMYEVVDTYENDEKRCLDHNANNLLISKQMYTQR